MKIIIIGAGGHGRVILDILKNNHQFKVIGFLDSNPNLHHTHIDGVEVLGDLSMIPQLAKIGFGGAIVAIGDNGIRDKFARSLEKTNIGLVNAIHPSANIAGNASIGKNVVIASGANVCAHAKIADSVILNTGCIVEHESTIKQGAHICPGVKLAGHVTVNESAFVGIGATVVQGITIGESAVVGAGSVVLENVPPYHTVVGVPARIVKTSHINPSDTGIRTLIPGTDELAPARQIVTRPTRQRPEPNPTAATQET